ncbi:BnaCnng50810D [Brassica napus]|uniref:BnaCnng50810D protein n=1 Tax=Brassica napus TaxID=3708 RepID=A0A078JM23_BRANA|nr:BnaCnng50810D [Brassica napus]
MQEFYAVTGLKCEADKDTDFEALRNDKGVLGHFAEAKWRKLYGNGKVSYHDITALETALGKKAVVFPFISDTGNNDVVAIEEDMRTQDQLHEKERKGSRL